MSGFVFVVLDAEEEVGGVDLPIEGDGTLLLSVLQSQFREASGLKYRCVRGGGWIRCLAVRSLHTHTHTHTHRNPSTGRWVAVRLTEGKLYPPIADSSGKNTWGSSPYTVAGLEQRGYSPNPRSSPTPQRKDHSHELHRGRSRESSPAPQRSREPSPAPQRSREPSPAPQRARGRSPLRWFSRSRDPSPDPQRSKDSSPGPQRSRDTSPGPRRSRESSPGPQRSRESSPGPRRSRESSPGGREPSPGPGPRRSVSAPGGEHAGNLELQNIVFGVRNTFWSIYNTCAHSHMPEQCIIVEEHHMNVWIQNSLWPL